MRHQTSTSLPVTQNAATVKPKASLAVVNTSRESVKLQVVNGPRTPARFSRFLYTPSLSCTFVRYARKLESPAVKQKVLSSVAGGSKHRQMAAFPKLIGVNFAAVTLDFGA